MPNLRAFTAKKGLRHLPQSLSGSFPAGTEFRPTLTFNLDTTADIFPVFGVCLRCTAAERHLGNQFVTARKPEKFLNGVVDHWIIMLNIGTEPQFRQSCPKRNLEHTVGVIGPQREIFRIPGHLFLHGANDIFVDKVQNRTCRRTESVDFLAGHLPAEGFVNPIPQFILFGTKRYDDPLAPHIERIRHKGRRFLDQIQDFLF